MHTEVTTVDLLMPLLTLVENLCDAGRDPLAVGAGRVDHAWVVNDGLARQDG
jgi:hypothetical protein